MTLHGNCRTEFLVTVFTCEMFCLLMLVKDDLVVEDFVAIVAERFHIAQVTFSSPHLFI